MSEVLYQYALNANLELINIESVKNGVEYYCPGCKNKMIPKCGNIKQHHFAHKPSSELNVSEKKTLLACLQSSESYLHNAFKTGLYQILKDKIEHREPFMVHWNASNLGNQVKNLLEDVDSIEIEKFSGTIKPDITLYDKYSKAKIAIEIVVHNKPDKEKLAYYSENKIELFEIDLDSSNLDVLNCIKTVSETPTVFTYIPDSYNNPEIPKSSICKICGGQTYFSYLNITKINCPYCNTINRFAFRSTMNKRGESVIYTFNKFTSITEKNIFDMHGLFYEDKKYFAFLCKNENCRKQITTPIGMVKDKIIYPLGYFCAKCNGKITDSITYNNQKFQNHAEEKWAKFFDENKIEYEYNPKEYRVSEINPFPVFFLKEAKQLFRANKHVNFDKDYKKAKRLYSVTGIDVILGFENGNYCVCNEDGYFSEEESIMARCNNCNIYYFTSNGSDWTCKKCKYH